MLSDILLKIKHVVHKILISFNFARVYNQPIVVSRDTAPVNLILIALIVLSPTELAERKCLERIISLKIILTFKFKFSFFFITATHYIKL